MDVLALLPKSWQLQAITIWNTIGVKFWEHCWLSEFSNLGFIDYYMMAPIWKKLPWYSIAPIEISYDFWFSKLYNSNWKAMHFLIDYDQLLCTNTSHGGFFFLLLVLQGVNLFYVNGPWYFNNHFTKERCMHW